MKPYGQLTPRGQALRLRRLARNALEEFDLGPYRLRLIKHLVNTTFRLDCDRGAFVVRVHRTKDRTVGEIESEVAWLEALARDAGVAVQTPRRARDGRLVVRAAAPGAEACPVTVLSWIRGRVLPSGVRSARHFALVGRLTARLHRHSQTWRPPPGFERPVLDAAGFIGERAPYSLQALGHLLPADLRRDLEEVYRRLLAAEAELAPRRDLFGLVHRDLTFSNVLFAADEARAIDFDEGGFGCYLHDCGASLNGARWNDGYAENRDAYLEAYHRVRPLDGDVPAYLPLFMAVRTAAMILWAADQSPTHGWISSMAPWVRELLADLRAAGG